MMNHKILGIYTLKRPYSHLIHLLYLEKEKLMPREVRWLAYGHTTLQWASQDWNSVQLAPRPGLFLVRQTHKQLLDCLASIQRKLSNSRERSFQI